MKKLFVYLIAFALFSCIDIAASEGDVKVDAGKKSAQGKRFNVSNLAKDFWKSDEAFIRIYKATINDPNAVREPDSNIRIEMPLLTYVSSQFLYGRRAPNLITFLLDQGAKLNEPTSEGDTPLIIAAQSFNDEGVPVLLHRGAARTIQNNQGKTALDLVQERIDSETAEIQRIERDCPCNDFLPQHKGNLQTMERIKAMLSAPTVSSERSAPAGSVSK